jgi:hypothetical protein
LERPQPARNERARTNEVDADERRRIIGREDDLVSVGGRCRVFPERRRSEWSGKHPFGAASQAWRHDRVSGTGLLSQMLERRWWPAHAGRPRTGTPAVVLDRSTGRLLVHLRDAHPMRFWFWSP